MEWRNRGEIINIKKDEVRCLDRFQRPMAEPENNAHTHRSVRHGIFGDGEIGTKRFMQHDNRYV